MYDKKKHKQQHLKRVGITVYGHIGISVITASIKRLFAKTILLCQTLGIIRISTQASTTFKSKLHLSEHPHTVNTTSTITWSGYQNIVNLFSEVV